MARIAGLFSGRGFNIDTLNVGPTHEDGRSRITVTLNGDEKALDQCIKQLDKLIDVIKVENFVGDEGVGRELVLVKVSADSKPVGKSLKYVMSSGENYRCLHFFSGHRSDWERK